MTCSDARSGWPPPPRVDRPAKDAVDAFGEPPPGDIDRLLDTMAEQFPNLRWTARADSHFRLPCWYVTAVDEDGWMVGASISVHAEEIWPQMLAYLIHTNPRPTVEGSSVDGGRDDTPTGKQS